jgi:PAS domain S-box-containing protein
MAVKDGNPALLSILDKGVKNARESGVLESIERKWLGTVIAFPQSPFEKYRLHLLVLFAGMAAMVLAVWFWNVQLRRKVAASTAELSRSEGTLRAILAASPVGIVLLENRKVKWANEAWRAMFGFAGESDYLEKETTSLYASEEEFKRVGELYRNLETGNVISADVRLKRTDGSFFDGHLTLGTLFPDDPFKTIIATLNDISSRKAMEAALRESERKFHELFNSIADTIYTQDLEGRFLSVNPSITKFFGYEGKELIGRLTSDFMKPEFRSHFGPGYLSQVVEKGVAEGVTCYLTKEGRQVYMEYHSALVTPPEGAPYISGMGRDVTERILADRQIKKLNEEVLHAKKMESIGVLAGGIAHNFNNILMGIQGNISLLLMGRKPDHPDFKRLNTIEQLVQSGSGLTKELLGFARGGKYEVAPTDINGLIRKNSGMFGSTRKEIVISESYEQNVWTVEVDGGQIEQALLNIYINSWQAMPSGGEMRIQTENVMVDGALSESLSVPPGGYVKVSIADSGVGMDETTLRKIFDPFFTTKEAGKGTGLGLASTYGIVRNHGGAIDVHSRKGEGTTFEIYLPATDAPIGPPRSETQCGDCRHEEKTILLVDDEEMVREVGGEMLEAIGCRVLFASNGAEALDVYRRNMDRIDMAIIDMVMPGMGGRETFAALKEINPEVRALLASGYSIDGQAREILAEGCRGFIQKPFSLAELCRKMTETIDG